MKRSKTSCPQWGTVAKKGMNIHWRKEVSNMGKCGGKKGCKGGKGCK